MMDYREWRFLDEGLLQERRKELKDELLADEQAIRIKREQIRVEFYTYKDTKGEKV